MTNGMRFIFGILASLSFLSPKAQTHLPVSSMNHTLWQSFPGPNPYVDSSHLNQKWYFSKYAGISAGFGFYNGGSATYVSAPFGLQLNHPLNNNLIAFAGISAAPVFFNFNGSYAAPFNNQSYPGRNPSNAYGFGFNSRVEMGLMYINDTKTFSISGRIAIERSSYPDYPAERVNTKNNNR